MRFQRPTAVPAKVDLNMTPMIDVVFQLMIFFMLTLKIATPEGDFSINMPQPGVEKVDLPEPISDVRVRLTASPDGSLAELKIGRRNLGNTERAFSALNSEILTLFGPPGNARMQDVAVEIDADYGLNYQEVVKAITACTGRIDPRSKQVVRYVQKIKFAPSRAVAAR